MFWLLQANEVLNMSDKEQETINYIFLELVITNFNICHSGHSSSNPAAGSIYIASGCCMPVYPWPHVPSHHWTRHVLGVTRNGVMLLAIVEELLHNPVWNSGLCDRNNNKYWRDYKRIWRYWLRGNWYNTWEQP